MSDTATDQQSVRSPFVRLAELLEGVAPGQTPINLTVGEPRHGVPDFVAGVLAGAIDGFGRYPAIRGTADFRNAIGDWLDRRYQLAGALDRDHGILPLNGSREGLFFALIAAATDKARPGATVLLPNPFYQTYAAGAIAANARLHMTGCDRDDGFLPHVGDVSSETLAQSIAAIIASPANPQGAVLSEAMWVDWIKAAQEYDFLLIADECYSEIYRDTPPVGVLEAAQRNGLSFTNIVTMNSLSKRSNMPGLRCGFAAGDPAFLSRWAVMRNMVAPQVPEPVQAVAVAAYGDEDHVTAYRALYNAKYTLADEILDGRFGYQRPQGGFFLWLDAAAYDGGVAAARRLWSQAGLRVIPGGYLALPDASGDNPAERYIRLAMVESLDVTEAALRRLVDTLT